MELKFNETNQLRTRLAILESQLKFANKKNQTSEKFEQE